MRRNILLTVSYDGTDFSGWQVQARDRSVQGVLEEALEDLHGTSIPLTGAGRTDAGVHAIGQNANFYTEMDGIPDLKFREALNSRLPRDVRILESREVQEDFHARRSARCRVYEYRILEGAACPAHLVRYRWLHHQLPPLGLLCEFAAILPGEKDFTTFTAAGDASPSKVRYIQQAAFLKQGPELVFRIAGNAFLWRMVRSLVGTILDVAKKDGRTEDFRRILDSRDREAAGPTAPPWGLFLTKVYYGPDTGIR